MAKQVQTSPKAEKGGKIKNVQLKTPGPARSAKDHAREAKTVIAHMSKQKPTWWIFAKGKTREGYLKSDVRYFLGIMDGALSRESAVKQAQKRYPQYVGEMILEKTEAEMK